MQPLLTVREAAQLLKVREATIREWVNKGRLPAHKLGKSWRISEDGVQKLLHEGATPPVA